MTIDPPTARPIVIHIDFAEPLDCEAYAARLRSEPAFSPKTTLPEGEVADVRLADHCKAPSLVPTVLISRRVDGTASSCGCCHALSSGDRWRELLGQIATLTAHRNDTVRPKDELANLTKREHDVLRLVGHGKSVSECAEAMGVAPSTVGNHKYRLMRKLGVTTSLQLLRIAVRNGLADI